MPNILYHGTTVANLKILEPRLRHTPESLKGQKRPLIYSTPDPLYAAGHAFNWTSDEGIDLFKEEGKIALWIPVCHETKLHVKIFVYEVSADKFKLLEKDDAGCEIYISESSAKIIGVKEFESVYEAFEFYGGKVIFYSPKHN